MILAVLFFFCYKIVVKYPLQAPEGWEGGVGFISKEIIQTYCPAPAPDIKVFLSIYLSIYLYIYNENVDLFQILRCGPPPMNKAMAANLDSLGYSSEMQFQF